MRHILTDEIDIEMIYLNVRGLNGQWKQNKIQELADSRMYGKNRILALTETRLQSDFRLKGFKSIQTSHSSKGGCIIAANTERQKNIKTIMGNLAWMSVAIK